FVASFIILGVLGTLIATGPRTALAQLCTAYYFLFFLAMPWYTSREKTTTPPERVTGRFITIPQLLLSLVVLGALVFVPLKAVGAESSAHLEPFSVDLENKAGLQSGAAIFVNNCMGCHGAQYSRYNRVGTDLGIPEDLIEELLIFDPDTSVGDLMTTAMPKEQAKNWFGVAPPDLTLVEIGRAHV